MLMEDKQQVLNIQSAVIVTDHNYEIVVVLN